MKKTTISHLLFAAALATSSAALAQDKPKAAGALEYDKVTATVDAINQTTREVTLKIPNGNLIHFVAGPEVKNLAQVSKGDIVTIEHARALLIGLEKSTSTSRSRVVTEAKKGAEPGKMPAGVVVTDVKVVASIEAIDTKNNLVTLRGPEHTVTLKVGDPKNLQGFKVGDFVAASYTEATAIRVDKAPAAAPKK